jgi:hypothetical protein
MKKSWKKVLPVLIVMGVLNWAAEVFGESFNWLIK